MTTHARHRLIAGALCIGKLLALAMLAMGASITHGAERPSPPFPVRVMIVNAFGFEAAPWLAELRPPREIPVPGLSADAPVVRCTDDGVCQMTTGMGHANAAASTTAVIYSGLFDLSRAYFLIAGIAGIDPGHGTIGSVAWARYAVDIGIAHEIDPREAPRSWASGYFGVMTDGPGTKPAFDYHTEVFRLDEALLQAALRVSRAATLEDRDDVRAYRARYPAGVAREPPGVVQCDTASGDTWWGGRRLGTRVAVWTRLLTDGAGVYCTTQQEDNATLNALTRGARSGLLDLARVAILRSGSDFDRPYPGQSVRASMLAQRGIQGAGLIAVNNLVRAGLPLVREIVVHWDDWSDRVPRADAQ